MPIIASLSILRRHVLPLGQGNSSYGGLALALVGVHPQEPMRIRALTLEFGHSSLVSLVTRAQMLECEHEFSRVLNYSTHHR